MRDIQVGIALSKNAEGYLKFLLWTMGLTVSSPRRVKLLLGLNHGVDADAIRQIAEASGFEFEIVSLDVGNLYGSDNHGRALDIIFSQMKSGLGMLMDVDIAFLEKGWDILLEERLDAKHPIIGTEYDGPKYLNFPNVICAMFDVDALAMCGISLVPNGAFVELNGQEAMTYGRLPGDVILLDTGYQLPLKLKEKGFDGWVLNIRRAQSPQRIFMVDGLRGEEYQLDGTPILTHIGRSYTRALGIDADAIEWEKRVREWLNK